MTNTGGRRAALVSMLADDVDAALVTRLVNVRYLTGFTGSSAALLVPREGPSVLATDGRYATQAADEAPDVEVLVGGAPSTDLVRRAAQIGGRVQLTIERDHVSLALFDSFVAQAGETVVFADSGRAVERLRTVKDDAEIALLRQACAVTDEVFAAVLLRLRVGVTERQISWALTEAMHERGAEPAFESIVAFGDNSARPHHRPTDRPARSGDFVKLDFGAKVGGYHADMTRTVVVGRPAQWQVDLHALVQSMQEELRGLAVPGAAPVDLDAAMQERIRAGGYEPSHGLGHGVGLEIHEAPFLTPLSTAGPLARGVPVTVEPGVYLPGRGGVRVEDTVVVRDGGAESLTTSPRDLTSL